MVQCKIWNFPIILTRNLELFRRNLKQFVRNFKNISVEISKISLKISTFWSRSQLKTLCHNHVHYGQNLEHFQSKSQRFSEKFQTSYEVVQELFVHYFNYDSFLHYPIPDALLRGPAGGLKGKISAGFDFKFQPSLQHFLWYFAIVLVVKLGIFPL